MCSANVPKAHITREAHITSEGRITFRVSGTHRSPSVLKNTRRMRHTREVFFISLFFAYFIASSTATAQATVAPTMGLLPMPMRPIISTCAGTEDEPANCASECILPMVSVMP